MQQISIDSWYAVPAGRSAANQPHAAAAVDRRDKRTGARQMLHAFRYSAIVLINSLASIVWLNFTSPKRTPVPTSTRFITFVDNCVALNASPGPGRGKATNVVC